MKGDSLFSSQWHRVKDVCPRLASDVDITRHVYRGRVAYILYRRTTGVCHRLDAITFELVDKCDGHTPVGQIWEQAIVERDADAPTQDEWITLLGVLHNAELIVVDRRVPAEHLFERRQRNRSAELKQRYLNPLYMRFALHDPDAWLNRLIPLSGRLFSRTAGCLWLALVALAMIVLFSQSERFIEDIRSVEFLSPNYILLFLIFYPCLKVLHELAHALAVKRCGGAVHETGIALMVLLPLPYVDASASTVFPDKHDRMIVSGAGILVELACAALGVILWATSDGLIQHIALMMVIVGGVSTVLLNGNPLLKFDGYYLLADWVEIPNLAKRSRDATLGKLKQWITGEPYQHPFKTDKAERRWLYGYGVLSALYRTGLMLSIAWMLSDRWFVFGLLLALFAVYMTLIKPLWNGARTVVTDPDFHAMRSLLWVFAMPVVLIVLAYQLPLPYSHVIKGVVWLPEEAVIRAADNCEVVEQFIEPGGEVAAGEPLFTCTNPDALVSRQEIVAIVDELHVRRAGVATRDPLELQALNAELKASKIALDNIEHRIAAADYLAANEGLFDVVGTPALIGRFVARGEIIGYVVPHQVRTVKVAVDENQINSLKDSLKRVQLRLRDASGESGTHTTSVLQRSARASREVTSAALSTAGGGSQRADPSGSETTVLEPVIELDLKWPEAVDSLPVGIHVDVKFVYEPEPLANRLHASIRRAFGSRVES